jgi:hypothetical protein
MRKKTKRKLLWGLGTTCAILLLASFLAFVPKIEKLPQTLHVPVTERENPPEPQPKPTEPSAKEEPVPPVAPSEIKAEATKIVPEAGKVRIAIVIDDMGLNMVSAARAINLPAAVTLSFFPYAPHLQDQADRAKAAGHELLLHLPMEPLGKAQPGPGALLTSLSPEENAARLKKNLDSFQGFDGVNNHMGSKFTMRADLLRPVMEGLAARGLFFLDSMTTPKSVAADVAREAHIPTEKRDIFLDDDPAPAAINAQLALLEKRAREKGAAIAIGHPHASMLEGLEKWIPEAEKRGITLIPARDLAE